VGVGGLQGKELAGEVQGGLGAALGPGAVQTGPELRR
jgi:hypothetical protein